MSGPRHIVLLSMIVAVAACAVGFALPGSAMGQDGGEAERRAAARQLFEEGVALTDAERWADAADRFRRAYELRPSPVIAFNRATALGHLGRVVEASEALRSVAGDPDGSANVRRAAELALAEILPRLAQLTIRVSGEPRGATVRLDEHELPQAMWGIATPVDGGSHRIAAYRDDRQIAEAEASVEEGGEARVELVIPAALPSPEARAADADGMSEPGLLHGDREADAGGGILSSGWFWLAVGAVVAGAVVTGVLLSAGDASEPPPFMGNLPTIPIGGGG